MSERETPVPTAEEIEQAVNADFLSGKQIEAIKKIDAKNLDRNDYNNDMSKLAQTLLSSYQNARNKNND